MKTFLIVIAVVLLIVFGGVLSVNASADPPVVTQHGRVCKHIGTRVGAALGSVVTEYTYNCGAKSHRKLVRVYVTTSSGDGN